MAPRPRAAPRGGPVRGVKSLGMSESAARDPARSALAKRLLAAVLLATATGACSHGANGGGGQTWTLRDSAGVRLVHSRAPASSAGCITVASTPAATIGASTVTADPAPLLFQVRGGTVLDGGAIVLLNAGTHQLLRYSAGGVFERAMGGRGQGPGEFMAPDWMGRSAGDTLMVWDQQLHRLTTYTADGAVVATQVLQLSDGAEGSRTITGQFGDGSFLLSPGGLVFLPNTGDGVTRFPTHYSRLSPSENRTMELARGLSMEFVVDSERGMYSLPFGRSGMAVSGDSVVMVADNGAPRVHIYDLSARLRQIVSWHAEEVPVLEADRAAYAAYVAEMSPRLAVDERTPFPVLHPYFSAIHIDALGWLWVETSAVPWENVLSWLVFDRQGVLQCEVSGPRRMRVLEIGKSHLLAVARNDMDEEIVLFYPLDRADTTVR